MFPSRPSSFDFIPSQRTTPPPFIDFFAREKERENSDATFSPPSAQIPFAALAARPDASRTRPDAATETGGSPSTAADVTVETIAQYLLTKGYTYSEFLNDTVIQDRLNSTHLSAETLLNAIKIMQSHPVNDPLLASLGVRSRTERGEIIYRLIGIIINRSGFRPGMQAAARNCEDNPHKLITGILAHVRKVR